IVDEAHELVARVTGAASHELSPQGVERVAKRCLSWLSDDVGAAFLDAADTLQLALDETEPGRVEDPDSTMVAAFAAVRDAARAAVSEMTGDEDPEATQAAAAAKEIFDIAGQMASLAAQDVIWVGERERFG